MAINYINIFQSSALQNLHKLGFLVWKETIWQPWSEDRMLYFLCAHRSSTSAECNARRNYLDR
jgi:hypothetical protein